MIVLYNADFRVDERDMFHSGAHAEAFAFSGTDNAVLDELIDRHRLDQAMIVEGEAPDDVAGFAERMSRLMSHVYG